MTVDPATPLRLEHGGTTYYFCAASCLEKFRADPAKYLAPKTAAPPSMAELDAIYTCPMHPEIERDEPGSCPICGMALEPKNIAAGAQEDNSELRDMTRRFWIGAALSTPVFVLGMWHMLPGAPEWLQGDASRWVQFLLSTPVVLWCGWSFFVRGWQSICLLYTSPSPRDRTRSRMPSSA